MIGTKITQQIKHRAWVFAFMMACFFFSSTLSAQNYPPLVSDTQAENMLEGYMPTLQAEMDNHAPGTPEYIKAERKYNLYAHTWETLVSGRSVQEALTEAFGEYSQDNSGNKLDADEMPIFKMEMPEYGDSSFNGLVEFLTL